ncbi:MAG: hypothetical protein RRA63_09800 [Candidatus Calescibacterium sp.]|nr:hypothetical protein [Candidatus Calescibacterium sp.]
MHANSDRYKRKAPFYRWGREEGLKEGEQRGLEKGKKEGLKEGLIKRSKKSNSARYSVEVWGSERKANQKPFR